MGADFRHRDGDGKNEKIDTCGEWGYKGAFSEVCVMMLRRLAGGVIFLMMVSAVFAVGQEMPNPKLKFIRAKDIVVDNGLRFRMYEIELVNRAEFPNELFVMAPDLPPCGRNANASRTLITVYNEKGDRIFGHCAVHSNEKLSSLMILVQAEAKQPTKVFVELNDRQENKTVRSNTIDVEN